MLGDEKSTSTLFTGSTGGFTPCWMMLAMEDVRVAVERVMFTKPLGCGGGGGRGGEERRRWGEGKVEIGGKGQKMKMQEEGVFLQCGSRLETTAKYTQQLHSQNNTSTALTHRTGGGADDGVGRQGAENPFRHVLR